MGGGVIRLKPVTQIEEFDDWCTGDTFDRVLVNCVELSRLFQCDAAG
jgi:hypothetical protein